MDYVSRKYALNTSLPHKRTFKQIKKNLDPQPEDIILEIGAGRGVMLKKMKKYSKQVKGIDVNPWSVALKECPDVSLQSATSLEFPDNYFDKIYTSNTIEHIPKTGLFFKEASRVLKPKGRIVVVYPWEIFRGMTALRDALFIFKNPFRARSLHVHKFCPAKIKEQIAGTDLFHLKSLLIRERFPQYLTILQKRGMV